MKHFSDIVEWPTSSFRRFFYYLVILLATSATYDFIVNDQKTLRKIFKYEFQETTSNLSNKNLVTIWWRYAGDIPWNDCKSALKDISSEIGENVEVKHNNSTRIFIYKDVKFIIRCAWSNLDIGGYYVVMGVNSTLKKSLTIPITEEVYDVVEKSVDGRIADISSEDTVNAFKRKIPKFYSFELAAPVLTDDDKANSVDSVRQLDQLSSGLKELGFVEAKYFATDTGEIVNLNRQDNTDFPSFSSDSSITFLHKTEGVGVALSDGRTNGKLLFFIFDFSKKYDVKKLKKAIKGAIKS